MTTSSPSTADLTLALDALMTWVEGLPPDEYLELVECVAAASPPGRFDQQIAAARDSRLLSPRTVSPSATPSGAPTPDWVRLAALETFAEWVTGRGRTCMHAPDPDRPQPVIAAAWRPGLVVCAECLHLLCGLSRTEDARCDACGRVTTGVENRDGIRPYGTFIGPLTYRVGVCEDCFAMEFPEEAA